jgi:Bacterial archaeo-eukaryotic release factor family 2
VEPTEYFPRGVGPAEAPDLAALYRRSGPFVTLYVDTGPPSELAYRKTETQWDEMRRHLEAQGVDTPTIDSMAAAISGVPDTEQIAGPTCVVAAGGEVLLLERGPTSPGRDLALIGALPAVGPVIEWRQRDVTYVAVWCDRVGADIRLHGRRGAAELVAGERDRHDPLLHRAHAGGSSYPRYERAVANNWERNAKDVVDILDRLVERVHPSLVAYGGDPRAVGLLRQEASPSLRPLLHEVPLSRAPEPAEEHEPEAVHAAVDAVVAARTASLLDRFQEGKAKSFGVEGAGPVLSSLTAAQVETLLLHEQLDDERTAYLSLDPPGAGLDLNDVAPLGGQPFSARLVDVALAMSFLTGAGAWVLSQPPLDEGLAAVLRFPV